MTLDVPFMLDRDIEIEAELLLKSFEAKHGTIETPATPLDEIIENHLGLSFEIIDFGDPLMLGQLDIKQNAIRINSTLDPYENPSFEGRFNFTLGHEIGHNTLHRPYVEAMLATPSLFDSGNNADIILCRTNDENLRIETQADKFSSCFLMRRDRVIKEFKIFTGKQCLPITTTAESIRHDHEMMNKWWPNWKIVPSEEEILTHAFEPLAEIFKVSKMAMFIRLETLGLLRKDEEMSFNWG